MSSTEGPKTARRAGDNFLKDLGEDPFVFSAVPAPRAPPSPETVPTPATSTSPRAPGSAMLEVPSPPTTELPPPAPAVPPAARRSRASATELKFSCVLDPAARDLLYSAVDALAGPPLFLTIREFMEEAIQRHVEHLATEHNKGRPFPPSTRRARERRGSRRR